MPKRTYNPEDYSPETQATMKELLTIRWSNLTQATMIHPPDAPQVADIIEKAVLKAKQVTEDEVRAACAAVAEAHLTNPKPEEQ